MIYGCSVFVKVFEASGSLGGWYHLVFFDGLVDPSLVGGVKNLWHDGTAGGEPFRVLCTGLCHNHLPRSAFLTC